MNVFFQWQFPRRGCLFLLVAISVSTLGCRDSGQDAGSQQQPIAIQIDEVTEASELVQTTQRLRVLIDEARQNVEQREWNEAIEKYTTVLRHQWSDTVDKRQISLHNAEVFLSRGQAFLAKDFPQVAIEDFGDAIKSGDDDLKAKAYVERAKAEAQLKHWSRVVSDCTSAIRLQPKTGEAFLLNSRALAELGKFDLARNSMLEAEQLGIRTTWKVPIPESGRSMLDQAQSSLEMDRLVYGSKRCAATASWRCRRTKR